jgi:hypothetical protein
MFAPESLQVVVERWHSFIDRLGYSLPYRVRAPA